MATYTICYSGTDCFLDQALVIREPKEKHSYNDYSGYIPSKIHHDLERQEHVIPVSTTLNGCGSPYETNHKSLSVRIWSRELIDPDNSFTEYESECNYAPSFIGDSLGGNSVEIIAIAGIAKMLGVTLHLIPAGGLEKLKDEWAPTKAMNYTQADLAYPTNNLMWNTTLQATAGHYCLRWNEEDNTIITEFLNNFNQVALVGHSRGGVACIIAANYLAEWFKSLNIKVIALDPVPGTGNWWECLTHLPATLNMEYIGIYAIDETSTGFNGVVPRVKAINDKNDITVWDPLDPASSCNNINSWSDTNYQLLYTRGRHATVPGSRSSFGHGDSDPINNNVGASGNLVNAYVIKKLNEWNVNLPLPNNNNIIGWITKMNNTSNHFSEMRKQNYGGGSLGLMNGWWYFCARGISSSSGQNPGNWNYLEAFIQYQMKSETVTQQNADKINEQRGLIDKALREKYYKKFAGVSHGKVQPWIFITDVFHT